MNKLLEALADLLGVGTKTLEQIVDTTNLVLPDLLERITRELPLYRLLGTFDIILFLFGLVFVIATVVITLTNLSEYDFKNETVNKVNKILVVIASSTLFLYLGVQVLKATLTPTVYSIDYAIDLIGDRND